jgi:peptidase E
MSGAIVAMGGGGFSEEPGNPLLDRFALGLARRARPRVCFVATASGDAEGYVARFYRAFAEHECRPSDLGLFDRRVSDLRRFVLEQDVVYVGGGNTASLLAVWRAHGLDAILREALDAGAVLCGVSAGMNCWFQASTTDSFGAEIEPLHDGLGFVAGSACPHYARRGSAPSAVPPPGRGRLPFGLRGRRRRRAALRRRGGVRGGRGIVRGRPRLPRRAP